MKTIRRLMTASNLKFSLNATKMNIGLEKNMILRFLTNGKLSKSLRLKSFPQNSFYNSPKEFLK
jgi:hypothetical protein